MKATEFEDMTNAMMSVMEQYLPNAPHTFLESLNDILWDSFEELITEDDRNYN